MKVTWKAFIPESTAKGFVSEGKTLGAGKTTEAESGSENEVSIDDLLNADTTSEPTSNPLDIRADGANVEDGIDPTTGLPENWGGPTEPTTVDQIKQKAEDKDVTLRVSDWESVQAYYNDLINQYSEAKSSLEDEVKYSDTAVPKTTYEKIKAFESAIEKLKKIITDIDTEIKLLKDTGTQEQEKLQTLIKALGESLNKCKTDKERSVVIQRLAAADLNGDGWIGQPDKSGSLRYTVDKTTGYTVLWDPEGANGKGKILRSCDPSTGIMLGTKYIMGSSEPWKPFGSGVTFSNRDPETGDMVYTVDNVNSLTDSRNLMGAKVCVTLPNGMGIPVQADPTTGEPMLDETGQMIPVLPDANGKVQKEGTIDVRAATMNVESEDEDGNGVYDTRIVYKDVNGSVIASFRIKEASNYSFAIDGRNSHYPAYIDASKFVSTGRVGVDQALLDEQYSAYGILDKKDVPQLGDTMGVFSDTEYLKDADGNEITPDATTNYSTKPVVPWTQTGEERTGVIAVGVLGAFITAKDSTSAVFFDDPSKYTSELKFETDNEPDNSLFKNVIINQGSKAGVFAKGGDLYAAQVTAAAYNNTGTNKEGIVQIDFKARSGAHKSKDGFTIPENMRNFAYIRGAGEAAISNNVDDSKTENGSKPITFNSDDYYDTNKQATYLITHDGVIDENTNNLISDENAEEGASSGGAISLDDMKKIALQIKEKIKQRESNTEDPENQLSDDSISEWANQGYYESGMTEMEGFYSSMATEFGLDVEQPAAVKLVTNS